MSSDSLAQLRTLLAEESSWSGWLSICEHLNQWPHGQERQLALEYAQNHLDASWPPQWRKPIHTWPLTHAGHLLTVEHAHHQKTFPEIREFWIPPGTFEVGSTSEERVDNHHELMRHRVQLTRGLWVHEHMVHHQQWEKLMDGNPSNIKRSEEDKTRYPVDNVNWYGAMAYCNALSRAEGLEEAYTFTEERQTPNARDYEAKVVWKGFDCEGYRLPTEHEWEVFARAGCRENWYGVPEQIAWLDSSGDHDFGPRPLGQKQPNVWGFYDVIGNMWEWTMDAAISTIQDIDSYPYPPEDNRLMIDPLHWGDAREIVLRGGSWSESHEESGVGARFLDYRNLGDEYSCFRPVRKG
jgi:formylglycine-generating enzyme required for sulfatase activity